MSAFKNISQALIDRYRAGAFFTELLTIYENEAFNSVTKPKPSISTAWASVLIVPNQPSVESVGDGGMDGHTGFMQIDLNYPANAGAGSVVTKADNVAQYFKAGTRLAYGGQQVQIQSCGRSQGRPVDGWYRVSMTINWTAYVPR
jgi:hypothetical protein